MWEKSELTVLTKRRQLSFWAHVLDLKIKTAEESGGNYTIRPVSQVVKTCRSERKDVFRVECSRIHNHKINRRGAVFTASCFAKH